MMGYVVIVRPLRIARSQRVIPGSIRAGSDGLDDDVGKERRKRIGQ